MLYELSDYPLEDGDLDELNEHELKLAKKYKVKTKPRLALVKAVAYFGGPTSMADKLTPGGTRNSALVTNYLNNPEREITPQKACLVEELTKGHVTREELRPDLFGYLPYQLAD